MVQAAAPARRKKFINTSFTLPADLLAELRAASERTELPQTVILRRALRRELAEMQKDAA
jgi:predicted DNA-binding protein